MAIKAGSIVMVAGRNVVDRLQSAGLTGNVPIETVREIGNDLVVDKVPGEPDFTFSMESWDVTTDLMAFLHGKIGSAAAGSPPGSGDAAGTLYHWEDCQYVSVVSPFKTKVGSAGGDVGGGLIIPAYYPTRLQYRFGVTENAAQTVELAGGSFFYAQHAPVEETAAGDGVLVDFATSEAAVPHRIGGGAGTSAERVFGVIVDGILQVKGVDYVEQVPGGTLVGGSAITTIHFLATSVPANAAQIRFCYFTTVAKSVPQAQNADATVKPGAVRGKYIDIIIDRAGANIKLSGIQTVELNATMDGANDREMGNTEVVGREVNGTDADGTVTSRPRNVNALFKQLSDMLGVTQAEVFGYFYQTVKSVDIVIRDPKNPANVLKTLYLAQAQFQPPPLAPRVNTAVDFAFQMSALDGTFTEYKGARP